MRNISGGAIFCMAKIAPELPLRQPALKSGAIFCFAKNCPGPKTAQIFGTTRKFVISRLHTQTTVASFYAKRFSGRSPENLFGLFLSCRLTTPRGGFILSIYLF
jgi:hypothetical protein